MKPVILQLINSFHQGGSERQAVQLTRLLRESDRYRVRVACLEREGVLLDETARLDVGEIPEYALTSFYDFNALRQLRRFAAFLAAEKIDIVHTHDFYTNIFGMAGAMLARVPVRIASRRETGGMRTSAQRRVEHGAYHLAHAIVTNAEAVRRHLIEEGLSEEKLVTVYNGLDMRRVAPPGDFNRAKALAALNLPQDENRRFVTIVANLRHDVKDHPTFLRAAGRVRRAVPQAAFIIAGEGELTDRMRALAVELGIGQDVFFTGRCVEQLPELLALSDVCVLSSKAEGFSNSILEYMAAGRPVVATRVGGASEAIDDGETGFLVNVGDDAAIAAHLVALLGEPGKARSMGQRGKLKVEQKFSCEAQLESTEKLYERLLARTRSAPRGVAKSVSGANAQRVSR
ncbi:MAG TPA: glycosyltransferase [Pyrinomonadaceae bacterium]|jgi:glycosyltransferase involved in cell wall biosynthesis